jgi:type IV pilus assembly protein PilQ
VQFGSGAATVSTRTAPASFQAQPPEPPPAVAEAPDTRATSGLDLPAPSNYEEPAYEEPAYEEPTYDHAEEVMEAEAAATYEPLPAEPAMQLAQAEAGPQVQQPGVQQPLMEEETVEEPPQVVSPPRTSEVDLFRNVEISPQAEESDTGTLLDTYDENPEEVLTSALGYAGDPIDMSVRDADLVEVLRMFAQISNLNIVVQPGVAGTVTVELEQVPWDQAMLQILRIHGLGYELEGNILRIAPTELLRSEAEERQRLAAARALSVPLRTIIKRLSYANAQQVAGLLQGRAGLLSQRGSVLVDRRTNTLIIKELPDFMDTVLAIIRNLDTPEPQVMIEARIVETTKRFTRSLGFDWSVSGVAAPEFGNQTGLTFPANVDANGGVNLVTGGDSGFLDLTLGNVLNTFNLDLSLQAAETEGLINILSAPKVATLNNEQALIQSGLQIPIQTVSNNTVTVQFVNATLELRVTPQVTAEGTILMDIQIAKREPQLAFAIQGAANAPISTKEARTRVIVRDGGTTVIGGIYEVSTDQGQDRVPGLSNIPLIGHLFKNKRRNDENEELLIFITPRVINL